MTDLHLVPTPEAVVIPINPYQNWTAEELQSAINSKVERTKELLAQIEYMMGVLALKGGPNTVA